MTRWLMLERSPGGPRAPHSARIASVGRSLPATRRTTEEVMASTRHRTRVDLERLTGIHERRVSVGDEDSHSLAVAAATDCLDRSPHGADAVELLVSCSITKYRGGLVQELEPPMSLAVAQAIGAGNAVTFDVANACAGMLTGVFVVNNWIRRGVIERGLVVSGEYISQLAINAARHVRGLLSRELASLTLGDAGAAVLLERANAGEGRIDVAAFTTVAEHSHLCLAYPARHEPGGRMFTRSRAIHRAAIADTPTVLREVLDAAGLTLADVEMLIPHQTSARAVRQGAKQVRAALGGATRRPPVVTADHYGNTASTTHFVALADELAAGRVHAGDRIGLVALASGLELGAVLFTADDDLVGRYGYHD